MVVIEGTEFGYKVNENENFYRIVVKGGGRTPDILSGGWTDVGTITKAVLAYVNRKEKILSEEEKYKKSVNEAKRRPSKLKKKEG